jgi:hypothetical protein
MSAPARRSGGNRRRGRRGGRGRGARPAPETNAPDAAENPAETTETAGAPAAAPEEHEPVARLEEGEVENDGGFREPHPETPEGFAQDEAAAAVEPAEATAPEAGEPDSQPAPEPVAEAAPAPEPPRAVEPPREPRRDQRREDYRRDDRRDDRREREDRPPQPPRIPVSQRQWVKPADFRPAAPSAIAQAVEHATFIAEALQELHDQLDEVLELIEVAERQKLADERELDELRRALRRIQPQRQQPSHQQHHQPQAHRHQPPPRREAPRRQEPERRAPEPQAAPPEPETPPGAGPTDSPNPA